MKRTRISHGLFAAGVLALAGCTSAPGPQAAPTGQAEPVESVPKVVDRTKEQREKYSAALTDAFNRYEAEIAEATEVTYHSQVELQTVRQSLSEVRFDFHLRQALAKRGLDVGGLGKFALDNPGFFHAEQRRHWGRLAEAQERLAQIEIQPMQFAMAEGPAR